MTEWGVVEILIALIGLFAVVGAPVLKLSANMAKLNFTLSAHENRLEQHDKQLEKQECHAHESHGKLWEHNREQDKILEDHDRRIERLEKE